MNSGILGTRSARRPLALVAAALALLFTAGLASAPAQAQSSRKPSVSAKKKVTKKTSRKSKSSSRRTSRASSDAARRAAAIKKLNDYNYVKSMSPYRGSAYTWGSPW